MSAPELHARDSVFRHLEGANDSTSTCRNDQAADASIRQAVVLCWTGKGRA